MVGEEYRVSFLISDPWEAWWPYIIRWELSKITTLTGWARPAPQGRGARVASATGGWWCRRPESNLCEHSHGNQGGSSKTRCGATARIIIVAWAAEQRLGEGSASRQQQRPCRRSRWKQQWTPGQSQPQIIGNQKVYDGCKCMLLLLPLFAHYHN